MKVREEWLTVMLKTKIHYSIFQDLLYPLYNIHVNISNLLSIIMASLLQLPSPSRGFVSLYNGLCILYCYSYLALVEALYHYIMDFVYFIVTATRL